MSTTSLLYQLVQYAPGRPHWLKQASQRQALRRAVGRVYPGFARQHPEWVNYLFDERFLNQGAFSLLAQYLDYKAVPTPFELARLWAEQFTWSNLEMKERHVAQLMPVAADFLRGLDKELFN